MSKMTDYIVERMDTGKYWNDRDYHSSNPKKTPKSVTKSKADEEVTKVNDTN